MTESASFFVSYTGADARWAEWIAWQLEQANYRVVIQAWDFRPGSNFVLEMQKAAAECDRTLTVLSPAFLKSVFTAPEWAAAFATDPTGAKRELVPVRIIECEPEGLLKAIVCIDLIGLDEAMARKKLLEGVQKGRAKPKTAPSFPGGAKAPAISTRTAPAFPGALPPIWNVPFPSNPHFTGRGDMLEELHRRLAERTTAAITQPQAVHGLGGVGKTQLAVEYAWKYQADYDAALWVVADSPENAAANLATLARPDVLNLPEAEAKEQDVQVDAVRRWLRANSRWLLVFDSVDNREAAEFIRRLLDPAWYGHVIITSRLADWQQQANFSELSVDILPEDAAAEFLRERTANQKFDAGNEADARALARGLGCLPLALEQAAAYVLHHRITFAEYLTLLKKSRMELLQQGVEGGTRYPKSVAETWLVSEQQLGLAARAVLRLAAFLAPDDIPRSLFTAGSKTVLEAVRALASEEKKTKRGRAEPPDIEAALVELADHSLITLTPKTFSCHRLVQAVQNDRLTDKLRRRWIELALVLVDDYAPLAADDIRTWPVWEIMRVHVEMVANQAASLGIPKPTANLLNQLGVFLQVKALHREAEPLIRRALAVAEKGFGRDHPEVAVCLNNLATLLEATNRLAEAEPLIRRALDIDERAYGRSHPVVAIRLSNLASLLRVMNRRSEAEPLARRALEIGQRTLGPDHPSVATRLNNLGLLLMESGRPSEAEPLMRRALRIDERAFGFEHPGVATDLANLALLLADVGRVVEAEPLVRRALAIDEKAYGPNHPKVAIDLNNLAALLKATNRSAEAEPLMRRHVVIFSKFGESTGHEHPHMQAAVRNYVGLLNAMGLPEEEIRRRGSRGAAEILRQAQDDGEGYGANGFGASQKRRYNGEPRDEVRPVAGPETNWDAAR